MADTVLLKKIWTEFKIGVLVFTLIPLMHLSGATTTIGKSLAEVKTGDSFSITCTVSDLSGAVIFYQNSVEKGRCEASIIPGFPGVCVPGFSQDITTNISTYSVASANATGEDGTWSCKHSTETSDDLILIVYGFPANSIGNNQAYLPNNIVATTMDGTQLIVNISECVNPAPTINWTFYQDCEGISITPTIVITSTISNDPDIACSPPYSAYKSTIRNTDMTNAVIGDDHCYRVRSLVAYPGTSFMSVPVMFSANVTFTRQHTTTVEISTNITDEQSTIYTKSSMSIQNLQTTETTETTDNTVSYTSFYERSEVTATLSMRSVNRDENIGDDHLYLILTIVISSVCGVMFIMVLLVIFFYLYGRPSYSSKSKKYNKSVESAEQSENTNHRKKGVRSIRNDDFNLKTENVGDKKKKNDKNEQKGGKRLNDKQRLSKTENEFQFYNGRASQNNHAFELSEPVETRQNQMTYVTKRSDFGQIVTVPYNSQMNVNNSQFHGQTIYSGRKMLAFPQYNYNFSRTLRNQQDGFYLGGHHFNDRPKHSSYPYTQQRSNVVNANYRYDRQLSNTTHSGYSYDKNWLDTTDTIDNKPSFRHGQR